MCYMIYYIVISIKLLSVISVYPFRQVVPITSFYNSNVMRTGPPEPMQIPFENQDKVVCGPIVFPELSCEEPVTMSTLRTKMENEVTAFKLEDVYEGEATADVISIKQEQETLQTNTNSALGIYTDTALLTGRPRGILLHDDTARSRKSQGVLMPKLRLQSRPSRSFGYFIKKNDS